MKRRIITTKTCLLMGICGAALYLVSGVLLLAQLSLATYFSIAAIAMLGAMLLFLAGGEKGKANRGYRTRLLGLFFLLLLGMLPVPVGPLCYGLCLVLFAVLGREDGDMPFIIALAVAELAYTVAQTLGDTGFTGGLTPRIVVGVGMVALACVRALVLVRLFLRENQKTPLETK